MRAIVIVMFAIFVGLVPAVAYGQKIVPGDAYDFPKCLGLASEDCENLLLADGTMIKNPRDPSMTIYTQKALDSNAYEDPNYYYYYPDSEVSQTQQTETQAQTQAVETETEDTKTEDITGGSVADEDYPKCKYDENGPTNEPCITDDGELAYDEEHLRDCGNGVRCIGEYDEEDNDKDNDGTDDNAPRELGEGEEIHVGEAVQGYEDEEGTIDE
jgi:hypothetical protein